MAHAHPMPAQALHVTFGEMNPMRQPCAVIEPAHILQVVERAHSEGCVAEIILVMRLRKMRMEAAIIMALFEALRRGIVPDFRADFSAHFWSRPFWN